MFAFCFLRALSLLLYLLGSGLSTLLLIVTSDLATTL